MTHSDKTEMKEIDSFVIFPYLRTSEPVYIFDLVFRDIKDTSGLSIEACKHLEVISALFFLGDHLHITDMLYAILPVTSDGVQLKQLKVAQTLLTYLYTSPSHDGTPFLGLEHSSIYLIREESVSEFELWDDYRTENLWSSDNRPAFNESHETPGYSVTLNWTTYISVVPGSRIYPPVQKIRFNLNQDLYSDLLLYLARPHNWAIERFFITVSDHDDEFSNQILNALDWYNRSAAMNTSEEVALVNLAIALETLLRLEQGDKGGKSLTDRFKESINTLLGPKPQLESWFDQFYRARSKIVHQGSWPDLMYQAEFTPTGKKQSQKIQKNENGTPYGSLVAHGRRVFRLCVGAILSGAMVAEEVRLASWFVNNQERLKNICKILSSNNESPLSRLQSIRQEVIDLHEFWLGSEKLIEFDTLAAVGKLIIQTYLETNPKIPDDVLSLLQQFPNDTVKFDIKDKLDSFKELSIAIQTWKGDAPFMRTMQGRHLRLHKMREDPLSILRAFLEYVDMPHIKWRAAQN